MFDYLEDLRLVPARAYSKRKSTKRIIGHHSETAANLEIAKVIHNNHIRDNGWAGIAYNIVVAEDGRIAKGRGLEYCGGSVNGKERETKGMNDDSIAVCFLGNFDKAQMPEAQKQAGIKLFKDLRAYYGDIPIYFHKELSRPGYTSCPGKYFPMDEIRNAAYGAASEPAPQPTPPPSDVPTLTRNLRKGSKGEDVRQAQEQLVFHKAEPGKVDGIFGGNTKAAVIRFQKARIAEGHDLGSTGADGVIGKLTWAILMQGRK